MSYDTIPTVFYFAIFGSVNLTVAAKAHIVN